MEEVIIEKLVHGGQGLATLADGRKCFVWNALPGERLNVRIIKKKRSYVEAIAEEVLDASPERVEPREENYSATSPWQMMTFDAENRYKLQLCVSCSRMRRWRFPNLRPYSIPIQSGGTVTKWSTAFGVTTMACIWHSTAVVVTAKK